MERHPGHGKLGDQQSNRGSMPEQNLENQFVCGIPQEWEDFHRRHALFHERFPHLRDALNTAFIRTGSSAKPIDKFVFLYGRLCSEDFFEVLLCCGNGYGAAALKLVRSLYERAITLRYLHEHPEELDAFLDFHHVQTYKLLVPVEETIGKGTISAKISAEAKARYEEVKERFMVTACKKCGTKKVNHTWNRLDFVALARKTGSLGKLIVQGYYIPMRHGHATLGSLMSRLEETEHGISFIPTAQRGDADHALFVAHNIILEVLGVQEKRFKVAGLKEKLDICLQDFVDIHRDKKKSIDLRL
jgi:hypothetical protein